MPTMVWSLSSQQQNFEERVRTISVGITALGVICYGLVFLRPALIPLLLAVALVWAANSFWLGVLAERNQREQETKTTELV